MLPERTAIVTGKNPIERASDGSWVRLRNGSLSKRTHLQLSTRVVGPLGEVVSSQACCGRGALRASRNSMIEMLMRFHRKPLAKACQ